MIQKAKKARARTNNEEALMMKALVVMVMSVPVVVEARPTVTVKEPEIDEEAVP